MSERGWDIADLLGVMARLRDPVRGCAWDLQQDFRSIVAHTIEETCELVEAIERGDRDNMREELGDVLLQVVFHARMAEEEGWFDFAEVVNGIVDKLVRRHPHIFPDGRLDGEAAAGVHLDAEETLRRWDRIKAEEKGGAAPSRLPKTLSALTAARKLQKRARRMGAGDDGGGKDLRRRLEALGKIGSRGNAETAGEALGEALFAIVDFAERLGLDAESALRGVNRRFEECLADGEAKNPA